MLFMKKGKIKLSEFNQNFYAWQYFLGQVFSLSVLKKTFSEL